jgi:type I restriction enzyme M protein
MSEKKKTRTYHAWWGDSGAGEYEYVPGFCSSVILEEVPENEYMVTPNRCVGAEEEEDDGEPFDEKMTRFTQQLAEQMEIEEELNPLIINKLKNGFGV